MPQEILNSLQVNVTDYKGLQVMLMIPSDITFDAILQYWSIACKV